ncbi:MAG TPA: serine/threonine-protein kinase [Kofleriaceae bacterium]|nr:serine/threonine-protein kinase [Kofleriaceae bacterium]
MTAAERIGRYELVTHLASGGMGKVYLARVAGPGGFERHVVLKTLDLRGEPGDDPKEAMFLDEARLLGILHHQHIAPAFEVSREHNRLYFVMDYLHGHTAQDVWQRTLDLGAALPIDFALTVASAAASGLHYAHTRRGHDGKRLGIVHRDVTLSNLMIGFDGAIKVIDFGIAKAANRRAETQAGYIKGKLAYMAPEQLRGGPVDARTDVFALGAVLYELTTMRRAFREADDRATIERIKTGTVVLPTLIVPEYPLALERIVMRALRVDPRERYPDADTMRRDLEQLGHSLGLVLGDAAVVEVMTQLYENRREPWAPRQTTRGESELEVPVELIIDEQALTVPTSPPPASMYPQDVAVIEPLRAKPAGSTPPPVAARPRAPRPSRGGWIATGIVYAAAIAACVYDVIDPELDAAASVATAAPAVVPRPTPDVQLDVAPPSPAIKTKVKLQIETTPPDATVLLDGKRLGRTPLDVEVDAQPGVHVIKVRHPGYVAKKLEVELSDDLRHDITLVRSSRPDRAARLAR